MARLSADVARCTRSLTPSAVVPSSAAACRMDRPSSLTSSNASRCGARNFESIPDRGRAIERGIALAEAGDVVVIAGKGHETYQILGERVHAFDDRQVAREVLRARQHRVETARP